MSVHRESRLISFSRPTHDQMRAVADDLGIDLSDDELAGYLDRMEGFARAYALVDQASDPLPGVGHRRSPGRRPRPVENRYNAWFVKTSIREEYRGRLAGKTLAVKDSICVAGLPMMNGASFLDGTVPDVDATVVTRALRAGAEIVGKTNCEYLSPLRREPYLRQRTGHQSAQGGLLGRRLVVRERRGRGRGRRGHGPWVATRPVRSGCPRPGAASWG